MLKRIYIIIVILLLLLVAQSCLDVTNNDKFKVTFIDEDNFIYDLPKENESYYEAGSKIKVHSHVIYDVDLAMFVNGEFYSIQNDILTDDGFIWEFEFEMIPEEVVIEFKILSFSYPSFYEYYQYCLYGLFKGIEIYYYKDLNDEYKFVMMSGTNRFKSVNEVQSLIDNESMNMNILKDIISYASEDVRNNTFLYKISNPVTYEELTHAYDPSTLEEDTLLYIELGLRSEE